MANIEDLKLISDSIASYDDRLRAIRDEEQKLEQEKQFLSDKKDKAVWKLQDTIDELSES